MGRLSIHARRRIIHMKMNQPTLTRAQIAAALKFEDGVNVSVRTISNVWQRWTEYDTLADLPRSGRRSTIHVSHLNFIDQQINNDHEISSQELSRLFRQQFGMNISAPTRRMQQQGYILGSAFYIGYNVITSTRFSALILVSLQQKKL